MIKRVMWLSAVVCLLTACTAQAQTYRVTKGSVAKTAFGSGSVLAASQPGVYAKIDAEVLDWYVEIGDEVKAGDVLMQMENDELAGTVFQLESDIQPYQEDLCEEYVDRLLDSFENKQVVLTGVGYHPGQTGFVIREGDSKLHYSHPRIGRSFHGTGDIFAACFTGAFLHGKTKFDAARIAADFVCKAIENTQKNPAHWYGVKFETVLGELSRLLSEE